MKYTIFIVFNYPHACLFPNISTSHHKSILFCLFAPFSRFSTSQALWGFCVFCIAGFCVFFDRLIHILQNQWYQGNASIPVKKSMDNVSHVMLQNVYVTTVFLLSTCKWTWGMWVTVSYEFVKTDTIITTNPNRNIQCILYGMRCIFVHISWVHIRVYVPLSGYPNLRPGANDM